MPKFNFVRSAFWRGNKLIKTVCFDDEEEGTAQTFDINKAKSAVGDTTEAKTMKKQTDELRLERR